MSAIAFWFTKIAVADLDRAERFYTAVFGLVVAKRVTSGEGSYAHEEVVMNPAGAPVGSTQLLLTRFVNRAPAVPGEAVVGLQVSDVNATIAAAVEAGGSLDHPARDYPEHNLRVALIKDHEGHRVQIMQVLESVA
jgi:predicted enzyme related to lactoylglutathione lyase